MHIILIYNRNDPASIQKEEKGGKTKTDFIFILDTACRLWYNLKPSFDFEEDTPLSDKRYNTRRKAEVLEYLSQRRGEHVTAAEIRGHFLSRGENIGAATIYRQLDHLVSEGMVHKYALDEGSAACFEYAPGGKCAEGCFHCKCVSCGRLIHLHCHELQQVGGHLAAHHGFHLDFPRTVLYGLCGSCAEGRP